MYARRLCEYVLPDEWVFMSRQEPAKSGTEWDNAAKNAREVNSSLDTNLSCSCLVKAVSAFLVRSSFRLEVHEMICHRDRSYLANTLHVYHINIQDSNIT